MHQADPLYHLIGVLFVTITVGYILYQAFLQWLAFKVQTQSLFISHRMKRKFISSLGWALFFIAFYLGIFVISLAEFPVFFVLYWWSTLSLGIALYFIPAIEFQETLEIIQKAQSKEQPWLVARKDDPPTQLMEEDEEDSEGFVPVLQKDEDGPKGPPTIH